MDHDTRFKLVRWRGPSKRPHLLHQPDTSLKPSHATTARISIIVRLLAGTWLPRAEVTQLTTAVFRGLRRRQKYPFVDENCTEEAAAEEVEDSYRVTQ